MGTSPDTLIPAFFTTAAVPTISLLFPQGDVHYFGVTAVNVEGVESAMTPVLNDIMP